jgi:serine/threonine protein kinase
MGTLPRDTEEGRAFLQSRISAFGRVGFTINVFFYVASVILIGFLGLEGGFTLRVLGHGFSPALLINMCLFGGSWAMTRRGAISSTALHIIDGGSVCLAAIVGADLVWAQPVEARPEYVAIMMASHQCLMRSVMIPSSAKRSGWISAACSIPVVVVTHSFYARHQVLGSPLGPWGYTCIAALLVLPAVLVSTYISHIIYGLTQQVREATQLGQYTLEEKIGEGGMGIVFKAHHSMLRRPTAVKLLPPDKAGEHNLIRFEREVQLTSMLTHPNTIAIYDFGRTPAGIFYYAMEYLDGIDLEDLVEKGGPLDAARTIHILMQVAGALEEAHDIGLIHRDIKPANIIVCERGQTPDVAKVLDFGLVKRIEGQSEDPNMTAVSGITGTPLYLSPEAILAAHEVDGRSDIYALGCVGYYLLTGSHLFNAASVVEICGHHVHTVPTPPSDRLQRPVSADLETVIMTCLEKNPDRRPSDASSLHEMLRRCEDASRWDPKVARQWWREKGREIKRQVRERPLPLSSAARPRTLTVDMRMRASRG